MPKSSMYASSEKTKKKPTEKKPTKRRDPKEETANARGKRADEREGHKHDNVEIKDPRLPEVQA